MPTPFRRKPKEADGKEPPKQVTTILYLLGTIDGLADFLPDENEPRAEAILSVLGSLRQCDEGWSAFAMVVLLNAWMDILKAESRLALLRAEANMVREGG